MPTVGLDVRDLTLALASARVGVWKWLCDESDIIWSPEVFEIFRIDPNGRKGIVSFDEYTQNIPADDLKKLRLAIENTLATKGEFMTEHRLQFATETRWVRGQGRALLNDAGEVIGMTGTSIDITSQEAPLEKAVNESERLRLYSELASDYIYRMDLQQPKLMPSIVAGSIERTTGYTFEELEALGGWAPLVHEDDRALFPALLVDVRKGKPVVNEYRILAKSGEYRWLRDRVHPVLSDTGELIAVEGGVQDITERKSLLAQLNHAQKLEALAHLAGSVAHDFNNLLTVMFAVAGLLRIQARDNVSTEALDALDSATERAAGLTRSLLTFSRRQVAIRHPKRLSDLLSGAMPILQRATGERISLHLEDGAPDFLVAVDASQIELALLNLVVNARDAMPKGGTIAITTGEEHWEAGEAGCPIELEPGSYARISVSDTGSGITNEVMAHLFEPFFTTKEAGSGTGLGLAAVHGVIRQHDGDIKVETEIGVGTTFSIYLPKTSAVDRPAAAHKPRRHVIGGKETILVVEDDPLVRAVTVRSLRDLGYAVREAASAEEGLSLAETVDLVLSDVRLPLMPGTEMALLIAEKWPDTPIILMSGLVEDDQQKAVVESAQFPFLAKPFTQAGLAKRLREALDNK